METQYILKVNSLYVMKGSYQDILNHIKEKVIADADIHISKVEQ